MSRVYRVPPALPSGIRSTVPRLADATGGRVVCLATGPSLTQADVEFVKGKATVVAVNDAHRLAPWADVLYSSDRYWWRHYRGVPGFGGLRVTIEYAKRRAALELQRFDPAMVFMRWDGDRGVCTKPDGLRTCAANSGGAALNLAVHLGARTVILLGYDMGDVTGQKHFFGRHPAPLSNTHNFPTWRTAFQSMRPALDRLGIKVLNCSRTTSLSAFPCVALEDALP
jgi:hypothetical protein